MLSLSLVHLQTLFKLSYVGLWLLEMGCMISKMSKDFSLLHKIASMSNPFAKAWVPQRSRRRYLSIIRHHCRSWKNLIDPSHLQRKHHRPCLIDSSPVLMSLVLLCVRSVNNLLIYSIHLFLIYSTFVSVTAPIYCSQPLSYGVAQKMRNRRLTITSFRPTNDTTPSSHRILFCRPPHVCRRNANL